MLGKFYYPALFETAEDGITVTFPDFDFIVTQGKDTKEAFEIAKEVLGIGIEDFMESKKKLPTPSDFMQIEHDLHSFVSIIEIDMDEWTRKYGEKSVRRNVTLPAWLNTLAEAEHINFSSLLQEALYQKLGLSAKKLDNKMKNI